LAADGTSARLCARPESGRGVVGNVKGVELANACPQTIAEAMDAAHHGLERVGNDTDLCFALLRHTGLSFVIRSSLYYASS
jgi:hypothetical protein